MKRVALLIGNSNGLPGVKKDIANWKHFLQSDQGGQWYEEEIIIAMNPPKAELLLTIERIKRTNPDFAIVVFSGHGAYQRGTILEINGKDETINENDLIGISTRQISAFDCCRNILIEKSADSSVKMRMFSYGGKVDIKNIRPYYEKRIMNAIEQQVRLYACSIGESALDTEDGALYMKNLLSCSLQITSDYKLIGIAHEEASNLTTQEAIRKQHQQHPAAILPKCISNQQLIISINPNTI